MAGRRRRTGAPALPRSATPTNPSRARSKTAMLMEGDPFAIVEAMTIAAFATGCERGFIYIRGEYPLAARRLQNAIDAARAHGLARARRSRHAASLRHRDPARRRRVHLRRRDGALQLDRRQARRAAQQAAVSGRRSGLFGKPTVVNNVETLANLPHIVLDGGAAYARLGTPESTGHAALLPVGHGARPGVYEVEHGTTLGDAARARRRRPRGGAICRRFCSAAQPACSSGRTRSTMPLTFEGARAAGATLGSGVVMALRRARVDLRRHPAPHRAVLPRRVVRPMRAVPRRHGTAGRSAAASASRTAGAAVARRTSRCSTKSAARCATRRSADSGQTAANAIASAPRRSSSIFATKRARHDSRTDAARSADAPAERPVD